MFEMKLVLVHILRTFKIEPDPAFKDFKVTFLFTRHVTPPVSIKLSLINYDEVM